MSPGGVADMGRRTGRVVTAIVSHLQTTLFPRVVSAKYSRRWWQCWTLQNLLVASPTAEAAFAPAIGAMGEIATLFLSYSKIQDLIRRMNHQSLTIPQLALAGAGAGA